jgi:hypothetical protein
MPGAWVDKRRKKKRALKHRCVCTLSLSLSFLDATMEASMMIKPTETMSKINNSSL